MKHYITIIAVIIATCGISSLNAQQQPPQQDIIITNTLRWIAEMEEEPIEEILLKLNDVAEYTMYGQMDNRANRLFYDAAERGRLSQKSIEDTIANRRFRKAFEDMQKMDKKQAGALLSKLIKDNLVELTTLLNKDKERFALGQHRERNGVLKAIIVSYPEADSYRPMSRTDIPPTYLGRHYAVMSYVWLAGLLELQEVRPAIEEVIEFAREEFAFYNFVEDKMESATFKSMLFDQSLYNPSLLVTATLCDPSWKVEQKKILASKLVNREVFDYRIPLPAYKPIGVEGVKEPHDGMITLRYYEGITDEEFNAFFGK